MNKVPQIHVVHPGLIQPGVIWQCSTYLISCGNTAMLVDPGQGMDEETLFAGIARAGFSPEKLSGVLLTHCHADHVLGVPTFKKLGLRIFASSATADILRRSDTQIWSEHPERIPRIDVDEELADGQNLELGGTAVSCISTAGHTRGCMSFIVETENEVMAITGDVLMPDPHYPGWAGGPDFSAEQLLNSLEKLVQRSVTKAFTGHGAVDGNAQTWLQQGISLGRRHEWVLERARKMVLDNPG